MQYCATVLCRTPAYVISRCSASCRFETASCNTLSVPCWIQPSHLSHLKNTVHLPYARVTMHPLGMRIVTKHYQYLLMSKYSAHGNSLAHRSWCSYMWMFIVAAMFKGHVPFYHPHLALPATHQQSSLLRYLLVLKGHWSEKWLF